MAESIREEVVEICQCNHLIALEENNWWFQEDI